MSDWGDSETESDLPSRTQRSNLENNSKSGQNQSIRDIISQYERKQDANHSQPKQDVDSNYERKQDTGYSYYDRKQNVDHSQSQPKQDADHSNYDRKQDTGYSYYDRKQNVDHSQSQPKQDAGDSISNDKESDNKSMNDQESSNRSNEERKSVERRNSKNYHKPIDTNNNDCVNDPSIKAQISYLNKQMKEKLVDSKYRPESVQSDPNSPLYSVKSFVDLRISDLILKGIYAMGFQRPSHIQETMLPLLLASPHHNTIAQSQSGTGKTAAFLISSLQRVDESLNYPQVLVLTPTLELAMQTADVARKIAKFTKITIRNVTKGESRPRSELVEHVIVGTPGKMVDWTFRFKSFDIKRIKVFVLDEADVMIDLQGHREQSIKLKEELNTDCQLLLFSATYDQAVLEFAECIVSDPILITLRKEEECLVNVRQFYANCANAEEKYHVCANIFGNVAIGSTIIFVRTRESAKFLKNKLENDGHMVILLTGELTVEERLQAFKTFREGDQRVMITTNLTSRGIDIEQVTLVVNYDLPFDVFKKEVDFESYLHRIGRCGRFGKSGFAVSLIDATKPKELEQIKKIEEHFFKPISLLQSEESESFNDWD